MTTRPWRIRDWREVYSTYHTYGSIDTAMASAIVRCIHDPDSVILIENRNSKEVLQVRNFGGRAVLVAPLQFGPGEKWIRQSW